MVQQFDIFISIRVSVQWEDLGRLPFACGKLVREDGK